MFQSAVCSNHFYSQACIREHCSVITQLFIAAMCAYCYIATNQYTFHPNSPKQSIPKKLVPNSIAPQPHIIKFEPQLAANTEEKC